MPDILAKIEAYKREEIASAKRARSFAAIEADAKSAPAPRGFAAALARELAAGDPVIAAAAGNRVVAGVAVEVVVVAAAHERVVPVVAAQVVFAGAADQNVVADPAARYWGIELEERTLCPGEGATLFDTRFEDWILEAAAKA